LQKNQREDILIKKLSASTGITRYDICSAKKALARLTCGLC